MSNVGIVRDIYAAFERGDMAAVLGLMADDIVWNEAESFPYSDRNPYVGPQAVLEGVFGRVGGEWNVFAVEPERFIDGGETVVMLGRYRLEHKVGRREIKPQVVHVWAVRNGKLASFQQYIDTLAVAQAMSA